MLVLLLEITKCVKECESAFVAIFSLKNIDATTVRPQNPGRFHGVFKIIKSFNIFCVLV